MDRIEFTGRLGRDPERQTTKGGTEVTRLNVAITHRVKGENKTEWRQVSVFGKTGEFCANYLHKGDLIWVSGNAAARAYKNKLEETVACIDVTANQVEKLHGSGEAQNGIASAGGEQGEPVDGDEPPF